MWIIFIFAAFLSVMMAQSGSVNYIKREVPEMQREGKAIAEKFRMFTWAAALYVQQNPAASGSIYWTTIRTATGVPDGYRNAAIRADWRIVANGAGQWVTCAEMSEEAVSQISSALKTNVPQQRASDGKIVFADSVVTANTETLKCN